MMSPRSAALAVSRPSPGKLGTSFLARVSQAEERDSARGVMKSPRGVPSPGASPGSNKRPPRRSLADLP